MSIISAVVKDGVLIIDKNGVRKKPSDHIEILIEDIKIDVLNKTNITSYKDEESGRILLLEQVCIENPESIIVYIHNNFVIYRKIIGDVNKLLKKYIKIKKKVIKIGLTKKNISLFVVSLIVNKYNLKFDSVKMYIDNDNYLPAKLKTVKKLPRKVFLLKHLHYYKFKILNLLEDNPEINNSVKFVITIGDNQIEYKIGKKNKKYGKKSRFYYAPIKSKYIGDYAIHVRRGLTGNLMVIKRKKDEIEDTIKFKLLESKIISYIFYCIGIFYNKISKKKINIYYEKFASKAEEGTFDLFLLSQKSKKTKNYFVISKNCPDYSKIKKHKNIITKYSLKYYFLVYCCANFISTEAPSHLNVLRSNNKRFRLATYMKNFIFLQHGVTYMKCHGKNSTFVKGKEAEPNYIVVGSAKEQDVVCDMLQISENRILKVGLPIFDKIKNNHINESSEDIVTIMLTWKPYEEHLYDFEKSDYYKNILEVFNLLEQYVSKEQILIVPHPKIKDLLMSTNLKNQVWGNPISEVLNISKLLITDYSSVAYNSFYQGGAVIFYQPDLELYEKENGPLIPFDNEYIGERVFTLAKLDKTISKTIKNKKINLSQLRNEDFERKHNEINEFNDGKNIERLYKELTIRNII